MRRGARRATIVFALLAGLALGLWLARDLPRRLVRSLLADALDAEVELQALEIDGLDDFVLRGLVVGEPGALPAVERLRADEVRVRGSLGELRRGRPRLVAATGGEVRVRPAPAVPPAAEAGPAPSVGELRLDGFVLAVVAGDGAARLELEGALGGELGDPSGELRLAAASLPVLPVLAYLLGDERLAGFLEGGGLDLSPPYRDVAVRVRLVPGGATVEASSATDGGPLAPAPEATGAVRPPFPRTVVRFTGPILAPTRTEVELHSAGLADADLVLLPGEAGTILAEATVTTPDPATLMRALAVLPEGWRLGGTGRLRLVAAPAGRHGYELAADLGEASLPLGEGRVDAAEVTLRARGDLDLADLELPIPTTATLEVGAARAAGMAWPSPLRRLGVEFAGKAFAADGLVLAGETTVRPDRFGEVAAKGSLDLAGVAPAALTWKWSGAAATRVVEVAAELGLVPAGLAVTGGRVSAAGTFAGALASPVVAGNLHAAGLDATLVVAAETDPETPPMRLVDTEIESGFRLAGETVLLDGLRLDGGLAGPAWLPRGSSVLARGRFDGAKGRLELAAFGATAPGLARIEGDGVVELETAGPRVDGRVALRDADGPKILAAAESATGGPLLPAGWEAKVVPAAELRVRIEPGGAMTAEGRVDLRGTELASEDGAYVLQGFETGWDVTARGDLGSGALNLLGTARTEGFALLAGGVFADYAGVGADLALRVDRATDGRLDAALSIDPGFGLEVDLGLVTVPEAPLGYRLAFVADDVDAAYDRFVRVPLGESIAAVAGVRAGGRGRVEIAGEWGDERATARGAVAFTGFDLVHVTRGWVVRDLDLELPLDLEWGPPGEDGTRPLGGPRREGSLRVGELALGEISFGAVASGLVVEADGFALERGLAFELLGGRFDLEQAALAGLLGPDPYLRTGIRVEGVELAQLTARLGLPALEGEITGAFPEVRLARDAFTAQGGGSLDVFGGTVTVGDVSGEGLFTPPLKVELSARAEGILLGELTRTFDVGEVEGVMNARVDDCVLFGGTPVRFRARAETVERKGVPQTITVKAINNLAVLGTGGTFAALNRGLLRFFDRYRYAKLGAEMTLSSDVFLMRGLARRGDRELFLKGRPPIRVDVVNAMPGRTVSFSTMLERLRNVDVEVGAPRQNDAPAPSPSPPTGGSP